MRSGKVLLEHLLENEKVVAYFLSCRLKLKEMSIFAQHRSIVATLPSSLASLPVTK